jgi:hypothetical protein
MVPSRRIFHYEEPINQILEVIKYSKGNITRGKTIGCSFRQTTKFILTVKTTLGRKDNPVKFGRYYKRILLQIRQKNYEISSYFYYQKGNILKAEVDFFHTKGYPRKASSYHRLFIIIEEKIHLHHHIETTIFQHGSTCLSPLKVWTKIVN